MSGKLHQDIHKSEYQQHIRAVRREDYNKRKQKQLIVVNGGRGRILRLLRFRCFRRLGIFALCAAFFYGRALLHLLCAGYSSLAHSPQLASAADWDDCTASARRPLSPRASASLWRSLSPFRAFSRARFPYMRAYLFPPEFLYHRQKVNELYQLHGVVGSAAARLA